MAAISSLIYGLYIYIYIYTVVHGLIIDRFCFWPHPSERNSWLIASWRENSPPPSFSGWIGVPKNEFVQTWRKTGVSQIHCRMGLPVELAFSCLISGWILWFMVDTTIVNGGFAMVYKPTYNWGAQKWLTADLQFCSCIGAFPGQLDGFM